MRGGWGGTADGRGGMGWVSAWVREKAGICWAGRQSLLLASACRDPNRKQCMGPLGGWSQREQRAGRGIKLALPSLTTHSLHAGPVPTPELTGGRPHAGPPWLGPEAMHWEPSFLTVEIWVPGKGEVKAQRVMLAELLKQLVAGPEPAGGSQRRQI